MSLVTERQRSSEIYERLKDVTPGGVNSPIRACKGVLPVPLVAERGEGDLVYDPDGNSYIDYVMSWGPLILGHADPGLLAAVESRMRQGCTFGITTEVEAELAEEIRKLLPSMQQVRFVSSGTEATMSALRLARGATGRDLIVKFNGNYHGHADFLLVQAGSGVAGLTATSSSSGVTHAAVEQTLSLPFNDESAVRELFAERGSEIAAVICEPIAANMGLVPGDASWLQLLRELTEQHGALLIFDEVISGFRIGLQGAQGAYGITPDLTCLGKVIGGGFPVGAFGGRRDVMAHLAPLGTVYQSGTLSGNPVAMEAGLYQLRRLQVDGFYEELERKARIICDPVQECIEELGLPACVQRFNSAFTIYLGPRRFNRMEDKAELDSEAYARFFQWMFERDIYIPPLQVEAWFVSMAHSDVHLEQTRDAALSFFRHEALG